jgi:hypothetical protein
MLLSSLSLRAQCRVPSPSQRRAGRNRPTGRDTGRLEALETRALLSIGPPGFAVPNDVAMPTSESATPLASAGPTGYQPVHLAQAYGFNQIGDNGSGTTIAIVDAFDDPNIRRRHPEHQPAHQSRRGV